MQWKLFGVCKKEMFSSIVYMLHGMKTMCKKKKRKTRFCEITSAILMFGKKKKNKIKKDQKSTLGYVFFMGDTAFTWLSKKQPIVTLSTCEAEYVAASWCVCHAIWLRNLLSKMELKQLGATVIQVDNKSAIELTKNPVNHERSKHIDARFHFIRDHVKEGNVEFTYVTSQDQAADIFTKPLPKILLNRCKKMLGMTDGRSI